MTNVIELANTQLNKITMYKVVAWGLLVLLFISDVLAFAGVVSISGLGLLFSVIVLGAVCFASNEAFGRLLRAPRNSESYLITAFILACILPPSTSLSRLALIALAGVVAMASKYVVVYRGSHFLNPAALGAFVVSVTGLVPSTWWIATPALAPFTLLLALAVLKKQRKFGLFFVFAAVSLAVGVYISVGLHGTNLSDALRTITLSLPIVFMGSIMLTEPSTLASTQYYQLLFGGLAGVIFACELHIGPVTASPQVALLIANIGTVIFVASSGMTLRLKTIRELAPHTYELSFDKPSGIRLAYRPGQYLEWTLPHKQTDVRGNRRIFSIASAPEESLLRIGIKTYEPSSTFKQALLQMRPGDYIRAARVAGNFTLPLNTHQPVVFIAGGVGITPFRSMVASILTSGQSRDITLIYTASTDADFLYQDVFDRAATLNVKTTYHVGRLNPTELQSIVRANPEALLYISGPDAFVSGTKKNLMQLGVVRRRIKTDHFTGY